MRTLRISLIATAIATVASFWARAFGFTQRLWPAHPQMAGFLLMLVTCIVVQIAWPMMESKDQRDKG